MKPLNYVLSVLREAGTLCEHGNAVGQGVGVLAVTGVAAIAWCAVKAIAYWIAEL